MRIKYDVIVSPEFRQIFTYDLDDSARKRLDDLIFKLRTGEIQGVETQEGFEIQTEAGEIIDYELKRNGLFLNYLQLP